MAKIRFFKKKTEKEMVFTTNVEKVPSLAKKYAKKFSKVKTHTPKTKGESAREKLDALFS